MTAEAPTVYPRQRDPLSITGDAWAEGLGPWLAEDQEPTSEYHLHPGEPWMPTCTHPLIVRGRCLNCAREVVAW